jgi:hypothetical protein
MRPNDKGTEIARLCGSILTLSKAYDNLSIGSREEILKTPMKAMADEIVRLLEPEVEERKEDGLGEAVAIS